MRRGWGGGMEKWKIKKKDGGGRKGKMGLTGGQETWAEMSGRTTLGPPKNPPKTSNTNPTMYCSIPQFYTRKRGAKRKRAYTFSERRG